DHIYRAADAEQGAAQADAPRIELPPDAMIILPVRETVLFPGSVFPIVAGRPRSIRAAQQAMREERPVGILMQRDPKVDDPSAIDLHRTGTVANVLRYVTAPDGGHHLILQGEQRFNVVEFIREQPFFAARVTRIEQPEDLTPELEARMLHLRNQAIEALRLLPQAPQE